MRSPQMISVEALSCGYEETILNDLSITTANNLVILGANGAGKSTFAKALCALLPYSGKITLHDHSLQELSAQERARTITYIPPKLESYDTFITVLDFVLMGRHPYKSPFEAYSEKDETLARSLIDEHALEPHKKIGELSSGQQQLLLITQALAQESKIIIFDEPTANLDPHHKVAFYKALQSLDDATQKVVITHDLGLAYKLGYEVLFVQDGTAEHYVDHNTFFTKTNLKRSYGVDFSIEDGIVGVVYG